MKEKQDIKKELFRLYNTGKIDDIIEYKNEFKTGEISIFIDELLSGVVKNKKSKMVVDDKFKNALQKERVKSKKHKSKEDNRYFTKNILNNLLSTTDEEYIKYLLYYLYNVGEENNVIKYKNTLGFYESDRNLISFIDDLLSGKDVTKMIHYNEFNTIPSKQKDNPLKPLKKEFVGIKEVICIMDYIEEVSYYDSVTCKHTDGLLTTFKKDRIYWVNIDEDNNYRVTDDDKYFKKPYYYHDYIEVLDRDTFHKHFKLI